MRVLNILAFSLILSVLVGGTLFLLFRPKYEVPTSNAGSQIPQDDKVLEIYTELPKKIVLGETANFFVSANVSAAKIDVGFSCYETIKVLSSNTIQALKVGEVDCSISASYKTQTVEKEFTISIIDKVAYFDLKTEVETFMAGQKADGTFESYTLNVTANYSLENLNFLASENVEIISANLTDASKTKASIVFYLKTAGNFKIELDGFCFENTSILFNNYFNLEFENAKVFANNILTLYLLNDNKENAYENKVYDFAVVKSVLLNFSIVIEKPSIAIYENGIFKARNLGETKVTLFSTDKKFYNVEFVLKVEKILPISFDVLIDSQALEILTVTEEDVFNFEVVNILPNYAFNKSFEVIVSNNLSYDKTNGNLTALTSGEGFVKVYLSDYSSLVKIITIIISKKPEPEVPIKNFVLEMVVEGKTYNAKDAVVALEEIDMYLIKFNLKDEEGNLLSNKLYFKENNADAKLEKSILTLNFKNEISLVVCVEDTNLEFNIKFIFKT